MDWFVLGLYLDYFLLASGQKILTEIRAVIFLIVCVGLWDCQHGGIMTSFVSGSQDTGRNSVYNHHLLNTNHHIQLQSYWFKNVLSSSVGLPSPWCIAFPSLCGVQVAMTIFQSLIRREQPGNLTEECVKVLYLWILTIFQTEVDKTKQKHVYFKFSTDKERDLLDQTSRSSFRGEALSSTATFFFL